MRPDHDAVVLAGGRARRLGGASKPDVLLGDRRLIDHTLEAAAKAHRVVVVGPAHVAPPGAVVAREDPPGSGPVAALAAGLAALPAASPLVLVLACDVPRASMVVDELFCVMGDRERGSAADGAVVVDAGGRRQPLLALYRRASLDAAVTRLSAVDGLRDAPVRRLVEALRLIEVRDRSGDCVDVDTWADLAAVAEKVVRPRP